MTGTSSTARDLSPMAKPATKKPAKAAEPQPISRRDAYSPGARAFVALSEMIDKGRARDIAASLPSFLASSAGLGDVIAQTLSVYVAEKARDPAALTQEDAEHLMDMHKGVTDGVIRAHDVIANSPLLTPARDEETGRPIKAEIVEAAPNDTGIARETRLTHQARMFDEAAKL